MGYEYQVEVGGVLYGGDQIQSVSITHPLFDKLSVGNACSAELHLAFWPVEAPPKMAKIVPYIRQVGTAKWEQLGEFYIDTRAQQGELLSVTAFDPMLKGEVEWIPADDMDFPMPMDSASGILADIIGLEVDERAVIRADYTIDYPAGETVRDILRYIAGANGGNWIVTREGKLLLVPLFQNTAVTHEIGEKVSSLTLYDEVTVDGIALIVDDENEYRAGDMEGYVMEVECPYGSQQMAEDLLQMLSGQVYRGYQAQGAPLPPLAELGDAMAFRDFDSFLAYRKVTFGPGHMSEIAAPGENAVDHEYPYLSETKRASRKNLATARSLIEKNSEEIRLSVSNVEKKVDNTLDGLQESITRNSAAVNVLSDSIDSTVERYQQDVDGINQQLSALRQTADGISISVQKIQEDGVGKVTTTGKQFTLDDSGLHIADPGGEMENLLNETGMYVKRGSTVMLQANEDGVIATDVSVRNYLVVGDYSRLEDYNNGTDEKRTACFHLGG